MPHAKLPLDYVWRQEADQHILHLGNHSLICVLPVGAGWIVRTLLNVPGISPQQFAVRSVDSGKGWATRWTLDRQRLIARACGREDLAPPVVTAPPRRSFAWQHASWTRHSTA
jgi:hypothetical protein